MHGKAIGVAAHTARETQVRATRGVDWNHIFIGEELFGGCLNRVPELRIGGGLGGVLGDEVLDFYLIGKIS